jgi:hypothetical protein
MNGKRTIPLLPPNKGRKAKAGLTILFATAAMVSMQAQNVDLGWLQEPHDLNSELRTHTWSVYAQGGVSWASGVWYRNLDAKRSYQISPAVGVGVDFTIKPWVRVGADYLYSRYRREQRPSQIDPLQMPVKVYGNYLMNVHSAKLSAGFNVMEFWPNRKAQWLNIWAGTGVGYTIGRGNEYAFTFNNTFTKGGETKPLTNVAQIGNSSSVVITGNVRTTNRHENFKSLYVPAVLQVEADVSRRFTLGLKGEVDFMLQRNNVAPKHLYYGLATVRYNFVPSGAQVCRTYYRGEIVKLLERINILQEDLAVAQAEAARDAALRQQVEQEKAALEIQLADCEKGQMVSHFVQFENNSSELSVVELAKLRQFAQMARGKKLSLLGEASTLGTSGRNQTLSELRLARVVMVLIQEGFSLEDLQPQNAIGDKNGKPDATGRRVTIQSHR